MTRRADDDVQVTDESPTIWLGRHSRHRGGRDFPEPPTQVLDRIRAGGASYYRHVNRSVAPVSIGGPPYYRPVAQGGVLVRGALGAAFYRYSDFVGDEGVATGEDAEAATKSMYRSGLALALSTIMSAALGAGYWVLAARHATQTVVGQATALVSAMTALSMLGQLNLGPVMSAFLPRAGRERPRMVRGAYLTAFWASATLGIGFGLIAPRTSGAFAPLRHPATGIAFGVTVGVWSLFALQDFVLASMRKATWVPVENASYNAFKVTLLVILGGTTATSIYVAWIVPAGFAVAVVSSILFTRVLPNDEEPAQDTGMADFRRFMAGESVAMLLDQIGVTFLPIIVVVTLGPKVGGAFGIAWMCTQIFDGLSYSLGASLMFEGSRPGADVVAMHRALRRRVMIGMGALVAVAALGAPLFLNAFGAAYAHDATTVFRLLLVGTIARSVVILAICAARGQRRLRWVITVHLAEAVSVPAGAIVLGHTHGANGVGVAWALSQLAIAGAILLQEKAPGRRPGPVGRHRPDPPGPALDAAQTMVIPGAARRRRMPTAGTGIRRSPSVPTPPEGTTTYRSNGSRRAPARERSSR